MSLKRLFDFHHEFGVLLSALQQIKQYVINMTDDVNRLKDKLAKVMEVRDSCPTCVHSWLRYLR
jgi:hypothetical protein